jgi:hypothetical protein
VIVIWNQAPVFRFPPIGSMLWSMLQLLRRSRLLALTLILVAPGVAGSAVQWLHPCPVDAPWTTSHGDHGSSPEQSGHPQSCHCIGSCHSGTTATAPRPVVLVAAVVTPNRREAIPVEAGVVPVGVPSDLLPPATAPPLA